MSENNKFHEFALQSILFKGRKDWYFCYIKIEKIAHVLIVLGQQSGAGGEEIIDMARRATSLGAEIAHLAAGEVEAPIVLADVFALLSSIRALGVKGLLHKETVSILLNEFEQVAERVARGSNPSPFITSEHFSVTSLPEAHHSLLQGHKSVSEVSIKDTSAKGQNKGQSNRMSLILDLVRNKKSLSIREIASVIKDCSEKTIQRELNALIEKGLIRREGERRWSVYLLA